MFYRFSRWLNKLYANLNGYFWLPCPLCGKMFGGHESSGVGLSTNPHSGELVCSDCEEEAERISKERWFEWKRKGVIW